MKKLVFMALLVSFPSLAQESVPVATLTLEEVPSSENGKVIFMPSTLRLGVISTELPELEYRDQSNCRKNEKLGDSEVIEHMSDAQKVISKMDVSDGPQGIFYFSWGYNRGFHSNSDITVTTPDGEFTIKDAQGIDRPKEFGLSYLNPTKFTVPQYNVRLGYWASEDSKFGLEAGTDHMKWVFDSEQQYEIEGDYKDVWMNGEKVSFEEVKAAGYAKFFLMEHSDGYNYPFVGIVYREKLINTRRFGLDLMGGAHAGILFPKTRTRIADQEHTAQYRDVDNKFHVAGYAGSIDLRLRVKYKLKSGATFFLEPAARGVAGKVNNALFLGKGSGSISQSVMYTAQPMVSGGVEIPLKFFKKRPRR